MPMSSKAAPVLALVTLLSGCGPSYKESDATAQPPVTVGQSVTVQFRRDALGAAAPFGIPPTTDSMNGTEVCLGGKVKEVRPGWILLDWKDYRVTMNGSPTPHQIWIPLNVVLGIEVESNGQ